MYMNSSMDRLWRGLMRHIGVVAMAAAVLIMAGCGGQDAAQATPTAGTTLAKPVLATSELVLGENRFVFGLLDAAKGQPIPDVPEQVSLQFFKVHEDGTATKTGDAAVVPHSNNLPTALYVAHANFNEVGAWGALVTIKLKDVKSYQAQMNFNVIARGTVPLVGDPAPPSKNQTRKDVQDLGEIDSAVPHDDMHEMTIAEAVKSGKPTLILFAAPGFCPSFTCGPDLQLVEALEDKYRGKANFIHIESPNEIQNHTHTGPVDPNHNQLPGHQGVSKPQIQTANEWGLKTEPWIFIVDKSGKIAARFEGGLTIDEVEPAFLKVIQ